MTMIKVVILGASGGCVDILDTIHDINASLPAPRYECAGFLDDNPGLVGATILGARVMAGGFASAKQYPDNWRFVTGIGSTDNYWKNQDIIDYLGIPVSRFITFIHPTAVISNSASVGLGSVIYQNACVSTNARVGNHVLVQPNSVISHDVIVGDYSRIAAGVSVLGSVTIEKSCYIGANTSIRNGVTIGEGSLIGMGSVVLDDIPPNSVAYGNPAKVVRTEVPIITTPSKTITAGLLCAILAVFLVPAVFGILGVAAGMVAIVKDTRWRGSLVVILSAVGALVGYWWAGWVIA